MRIEEMPAVIHDWPEHTRLTEGDSIDTVRIVPGTDVPRVRETSPAPIPRLSSEGPARLIPHPSADDHHETGCESDARPDPPSPRLVEPSKEGCDGMGLRHQLPR